MIQFRRYTTCARDIFRRSPYRYIDACPFFRRQVEKKPQSTQYVQCISLARTQGYPPTRRARQMSGPARYVSSMTMRPHIRTVFNICATSTIFLLGQHRAQHSSVRVDTSRTSTPGVLTPVAAALGILPDQVDGQHRCAASSEMLMSKGL